MTDAFQTEFDDDGVKAIFDAVNRYYQDVTVVSVKGDCPYGHKVGEKFKLTGMNHDCICGALYQYLQSPILALEYGGDLPWEKDSGTFKASCPEGDKVQVEVRRVEQEKPVYIKTRTDTKDMTGKGFLNIDKYRVYLEVLDIENICMWKHQPGERFEVDPFNMGKCCGSLYKAAYPFINILFSGGQLPWENDGTTAHGTCPDPYDLLTYRLVKEKR